MNMETAEFISRGLSMGNEPVSPQMVNDLLVPVVKEDYKVTHRDVPFKQSMINLVSTYLQMGYLVDAVSASE